MPVMLRRSITLVLATLAFSCSSPQPLPGGPPPEYEPPRPFPFPSASASASASAPEPDAAAPTLPTKEQLAERVDRFMKGYGATWSEAYAPSGILVVAYKGEPVLVRGYGKADRGKSTTPAIGTRFRIGSITKQFTAAALLKLVEKKKVDLDASVRTFVTELPAAYDAVTVRQLLNQTSGVADYTEDQALMARKKNDLPVSDMLGWMGKHPLAFTPGSSWAYSNSNYYLASVIVERASKEPFETFLKREILDHAGMADTSSGPGGDMALGYTRTGSGKIVDAPPISMTIPFGAGFLRSSARDMLAWDRALKGTAVLSEASKNTMFAPVRENYGMGWIANDIGKKKVLWHNGGIDGFSSFFGRELDDDAVVLFFSNVEDFDATPVGRAVLHMLAGEEMTAPVERPISKVDDAFAKTVAGDWVMTKDAKTDLEKKLPPGTVDAIEGLTVKYADGAISAKPTAQSEFGLMRSVENTLFSPKLGVEIVPDLGKSAGAKKAVGLTLKQGGLSVAFVPGKPKPQPKAKADAKLAGAR